MTAVASPVPQDQSTTASNRKSAAKPNQLFTFDQLEDRTVPAITGVVFQDFNANGERDLNETLNNLGAGTVRLADDRGIGNVTVTAFDANNNQVAQTTSLADGSYSLNITTDGAYRVEFTGLPANFVTGPEGPDSGTDMQFVTVVGGNAANVNYGIIRPADFCEDNPLLFTNCYVFGDQVNGDNRDDVVLVSFPTTSGSANGAAGDSTTAIQNPTAHDITAIASQVGTTWGLGWNKTQRDIYASAFFKRHTGYGPNGPGAIYRVDVNNTNNTVDSVGLFADLNAILLATQRVRICTIPRITTATA